MDSPARSRLLVTAVAGVALALAVVAVPVLGQAAPGSSDTAAAPAASGRPDASEKPGKGPKADKPGKAAAKAAKDAKPKVPSVPVTRTGTVGTRVDADGDVVYTLTAGGTTYDLDAGPPWFWGDAHPLKDLVGSSVTITGEQAEGTTTIDVLTADGKTIREPGRPAWAGGWKAVGQAHPGWAQWKADKAAARDAAKGDRTQGRPSWAGPKTPEASDAPGD